MLIFTDVAQPLPSRGYLQTLTCKQDKMFTNNHSGHRVRPINIHVSHLTRNAGKVRGT